jgi:hypothetical protein
MVNRSIIYSNDIDIIFELVTQVLEKPTAGLNILIDGGDDYHPTLFQTHNELDLQICDSCFHPYTVLKFEPRGVAFVEFISWQ